MIRVLRSMKRKNRSEGRQCGGQNHSSGQLRRKNPAARKKKKTEDKGPGPLNDEGYFEIDGLRGCTRQNGRFWYLAKFTGYPPENDLWVEMISKETTPRAQELEEKYIEKYQEADGYFFPEEVEERVPETYPVWWPNRHKTSRPLLVEATRMATNSTPGMGRGRSRTQPAWMTQGHDRLTAQERGMDREVTVAPPDTSNWGTPIGQEVSTEQPSSASDWGTPIGQEVVREHPSSTSDWGTPIGQEVSTEQPSAGTSDWGTPLNQSVMMNPSVNQGGNRFASLWGVQADNKEFATSKDQIPQLDWRNSPDELPTGGGAPELMFPNSSTRWEREELQGPLVHFKAVKSVDNVDIVTESKDDCILRMMFPDRLLVKNVKLKQNGESVDTVCWHGGKKYELVTTKLEESTMLKCEKYKQTFVKAFYLESRVGCTLQEELNKLADFGGLSPTKAAARLELLVSPARPTPSGKQWMFELSKNRSFELIQEEAHLGCGFIPVPFLKSLQQQIGKGKFGPSAIQARIRIPALGLFKGVLMAKEGIKKIQLPGSMKKVDAARASRGESDFPVLLANNVFPSLSCKKAAKSVDPTLDNPTKSMVKDRKPLGESAKRVFCANGVNPDYFDHYVVESCRDPHGLRHAYLVGVADPTGSLCPGTVFVSGLGVAKRALDRQVFVTRMPATEKQDGMKLPAVSSKPIDMRDEDWKLLEDLPFGFLVFSNPGAGSQPLPTRISNGDLDGDLYLVCWDEAIVNMTQNTPDINRQNIKKNADCVSCEDAEEVNEARPSNEDIINEDSETEGKGAGNERSVDENIGIEFNMDHKGSRNLSAEVVEKAESGKYLVRVGEDRLEMTEAEIFSHGVLITNIIKHQRKGKNLWVYAECEDHRGKKEDWFPVSKLPRGGECQVLLAEYARNNCLLEEKELEIQAEKILDHRYNTKSAILEVQVLWDDGTEEWCTLKSFRGQGTTAALVSYAKEKKLQDQTGWEWLKPDIKDSRENWLKAAQDVMANVQRMAGIDALTKKLHKQWEKRSMDDPDGLAFGRAYKESNDLLKHGGRVHLPTRLRNTREIKGLSRFITWEEPFEMVDPDDGYYSHPEE